MHLIQSFLRNPVKIAVGVMLVALFGFISLFRMPMQLTPEVETPQLRIETRWPGASPNEVEREIVQEQEEQLQSVEGLTKMTSECMDSMGRISLEFAIGTNMNEALLKVNSRLQQVREYPEEADQPVISTSNSSDRPIAWFMLSGRQPTEEEIVAFAKNHPAIADKLDRVRTAHNAGLALMRLREIAKEHPEAAALLPKIDDVDKLKRFAEDYIEARFENVDGVANSNVMGGQEDELQVIVDPQKLAARNLTITDVRNRLRERNKDTSGGDFWEGKRRYVIRTTGQFKSPEEVESLRIDAGDDRAPVYIRDVAEVKLGYKKPDGLVRRFGTSNIAINVERRSGANVLNVMAGLRAMNRDLNETVLRPKGLELTQVYDETEYIYSAVGLVNSNIVVGGILTIVVLLLYLRSGRSTLVIALAIPTSIIGTFLVLYLLGRSLNVISLAGLAFAVGMLVDNAIVVLENIFRRHEMGESPDEASVKGTQEVWGAVVASTLTTLAVFLPVLFVQEEAGQLFRDIALAISAAVGLSLVVSVTVIPTLASRLFRGMDARKAKRLHDSHDEQPSLPSAADPHRPRDPYAVHAAGESNNGDAVPAETHQHNGVPSGKVLPPPKREQLKAIAKVGKHRLGRGLNAIGTSFVGFVVGVNDFVLGSLARRLAAVGILVGVAIGMSYLLWPKVEYLPNGNRNLVIAVVLPPPGYNLDELMAMGQQVEDSLRPYWDVEDPDSPESKALKYPVIGDFFFVVRGRQVFMGVRAHDPMRAAELIPLLREVGSVLPGSITVARQTSLFERGGPNSSGRSIDVEITGPELTKLVELGGRIFGQIVAIAPPGTQARPIPSLDLSSPEIHVVPKVHQSKEMNFSAEDLGYTIDALVDGAYATDYFIGGDKIDLTIVGQERQASRTQEVEALPIATPGGQLVTVGDLAEVRLASGPEQINRRSRQRTITVQVTPPESMALEAALDMINAQVVAPLRESGALEGGYMVTLSGTADQLRQTWNALFWNFILALLITYLLMAALFESWLYPFVIILSVPLGAVGGILGLQMLNLYLVFGLGAVPQLLDVLTMLGFVILIGTVVNNPILIVHQSLNHIREDGMRPKEAILESVRTRIRPIFMTTTTTVLGLMPLVFFPGAGSELYRGLGSVVLGGLLISTVFTLVLVPSLFSLMMDAKERLALLIYGRRTESPAPAAPPTMVHDISRPHVKAARESRR